MGTKQVRLDEELYERIAAHNRDEETMSETIARLIRDVSLLDLADEDGEYDEQRASAQKRALDRTARADAEALDELAERRS